MGRPPDRRPAVISELFSSKTAQTCNVRKKHVSSEKKCAVSVRKTAQTCNVRKKPVSSGRWIKKCGVSVRKPNEPFDKENTAARGSVPVSSSSSDRDTRCKETPSGDPGCDLMSIPNKCRSIRYPAVQGKLKTKSDFSKDLSGVDSNSSLDELDDDSGVEGRSVGSSCSIASMYLPPNMGPAWISDVELFSSKTASSDVCSVGDIGVEEFKHPAPGRTTMGHGCLSRSLSFPYNINIDPFGEKPGSDQWVFPEQMSSGLYPERWYSMSSLRIGIEFQGV